MANISITINSVGRTSANISFATSDWEKPEDIKEEDTKTEENTTTTVTTTTTYGDLKYAWSFGDEGESASQSGTRVYGELDSGTENNISGKVKVTCEKIVQTTTTVTTTTPGEGEKPPTVTSSITAGEPSKEVIELEGSPLSVEETVYTRPEEFNWQVDRGDYIDRELTATNWNNLINQLGRYKSYDSQSDKYTSYNYLKVDSGDLVTEDIFNQVASICGIGDVAERNRDITAAAVNSLVNAVNDS